MNKFVCYFCEDIIKGDILWAPMYQEGMVSCHEKCYKEEKDEKTKKPATYY